MTALAGGGRRRNDRLALYFTEMVVGPVPSAHEAKLMTATASYMHTTLIPLNHKQTLLASLEIQLLLQELNPILVTSSTMCLHHTF